MALKVCIARIGATPTENWPKRWDSDTDMNAWFTSTPVGPSDPKKEKIVFEYRVSMPPLP